MLKLRSLCTAAVAAAVSLSLGGCVLIPGMHMNTQALTPSVNANGNIVTPSIIPITATLIVQEQKKAEIESSLAIRNYIPPRGFTTDRHDYSYHVGPEDVLTITLWNYPLLNVALSNNNNNAAATAQTNQSTTVRIDSNGSIYYPYIGYIHVAGETPDEIRQILTTKLMGFIKDPQVTVTVKSFNSQQATVSGAVSAPMVLPITTTPLTVLDAVTEAKPIQCGVYTQSGEMPLCADINAVEVEEHGTTTTVNLKTLQAPNGSSTNWILEDGARIYVPNNNRDTVFVLGAVMAPGPYNMVDGEMSLEDALGNARGVSVGSNPEYTYVIRNYHSDPRIYSLDASSPDSFNLANEFLLKPQDVIFVSTSKLQTFNEVLSQINPTLTTAVYVNSLSQ